SFGSEAQIAQVGSDFDQVKAWSIAHDRPIFLGEFGAYDHAAMADRTLWTSTVARAAEERGFGWAYWQFSSDFIAYDFEKQAWVQPILRALLPESPALERQQRHRRPLDRGANAPACPPDRRLPSDRLSRFAGHGHSPHERGHGR